MLRSSSGKKAAPGHPSVRLSPKKAMSMAQVYAVAAVCGTLAGGETRPEGELVDAGGVAMIRCARLASGMLVHSFILLFLPGAALARRRHLPAAGVDRGVVGLQGAPSKW